MKKVKNGEDPKLSLKKIIEFAWSFSQVIFFSKDKSYWLPTNSQKMFSLSDLLEKASQDKSWH